MASSDTPIVDSVSKALRVIWWLPLLRGLFLITLGVLVMIEPLNTLVTLTRLVALFLVIDAVVVFLQGWVNRTQTGWRMWLVQGVIDLIFAALIFLWPGVTIVVFFYLLVIWTIAMGAVAIIGAGVLVKSRDLSWPWMLAFGLVSVLFGIMLLLRAGDDVERTLHVVGLVLGLYTFIAGAVQVVSAFSVRATAKHIDEALRGESEVLKAINVAGVAYAEQKAEKAAERQTAKEDARAEKEAEKLAAQAEREAEKEADKAAKAERERVAALEEAALGRRAVEDSREALHAPEIIDEAARHPGASAPVVPEPSPAPVANGGATPSTDSLRVDSLRSNALRSDVHRAQATDGANQTVSSHELGAAPSRHDQQGGTQPDDSQWSAEAIAGDEPLKWPEPDEGDKL